MKKVRSLNQHINHHGKLQLRDVGLRRLPKGRKLGAIGCNKTETGSRSIRLEKDEVESTRAWIVRYSSIWCGQESKSLQRRNWKLSLGFKAHHSFDHLEARLNLRGQHGISFILAGLDGHEIPIPDTAVDALLQEVGNAIQFSSCSSGKMASLSCCPHFVMKSGTCPKFHIAWLVDAAKVVCQVQESACALHGLLLVFGKGGPAEIAQTKSSEVGSPELL